MTPSVDALRTLYPHLSFVVSAFAGQPVVLECITREGGVHKFNGPTLEAAILAGFGESFAPVEEEPTPPTPVNVFD